MALAVHQQAGPAVVGDWVLAVALPGNSPATPFLTPPRRDSSALGIARNLIGDARGGSVVASVSLVLRPVPLRHRQESGIQWQRGPTSIDDDCESRADDALDLVRMDDDGGWQWRDRWPNPCLAPRVRSVNLKVTAPSLWFDLSGLRRPRPQRIPPTFSHRCRHCSPLLQE